MTIAVTFWTPNDHCRYVLDAPMTIAVTFWTPNDHCRYVLDDCGKQPILDL